MILVRDILVLIFLVSSVNIKFLETICSRFGQPQNLAYHQSRLERALHSLGSAKKYNLAELLEPPKTPLCKCRVIYDTQKLTIEYTPYEKRQIRSLKIVYNDEIEYEHKYLNRELLGELFALRAACDDVLIVKSGLIRDTSIANVAFFDGRDWVTPKRPLLCGTTRERYLKSGKIIAKDIFVDDLKSFKGVALMNAMIDFDIICQDNIEEVIC